MNCIIPFESKLKFDGPVKEICTISLEHEITENDKEILGNFIITGTYKEHELSVNTFDFRFTVPFEVELASRIAADTLEFSIDNFTYDIDGDEMTVNIDYIVSGEEVEEREEQKEEIEEVDPLDLIDDKLIEPEASEEDKDDGREQEDTESNEKEEVSKDLIRDEIMEDSAVQNVTKQIGGLNPENDYISFKIHLVKEEETIESICLSNKVDKDELLLINDTSSINPGDKILIPILK